MTTAKHNLLALFAISIALVFYMIVNLQHYSVQYNVRYVMDLYAHSQWSVKDAVRSIGDDGLYQAASYHILTTGKIAEINFEAPPVGKYLIMSSMLFFNNPYYTHPLLYILCAILVFKIAMKLTAPKYAWLAISIFLLEPLIGLQASGSLLDLPQLLWLLLHLYFLQKYIEPEKIDTKGKRASLIGLGISLGLFAGTKFGIFTIIIFICDVWLLALAKKLLSAIVIACTAILTYTAAFIPFIIQNQGNIFAWIMLEYHRLNFYRQSFTPYIPGTGLISMFFPWHFSWWNTAPQYIREWNLLWPLTTIITFTALWLNKSEIISLTKQGITRFSRQKESTTWYQTSPTETPINQIFGNYLILLTATFTIITVLIPFWPRYLTNIIPLSLLVFAYLLHNQKLPVIQKFALPITTLGLILHIISLAYIITPSALESAKTYSNWFSHSLYYDMYHALNSTQGLNRTDEEFWKQLIRLENSMHLRGKTAEITLNNPTTLPWDTTKQGTLTVRYETPVGEYQHQAPITLQRNFNRWEIIWNWNFILPDFRPTDTVTLTLDPANSCTVRTFDNRIAAQFQSWPVLYILPSTIYAHPRKQELYIEIFYLTGVNPLEVESRYRANHPDDIYTRIAPLVTEYSETKINELKEMSGFQTQEEIVWVISKDLSEQQRADALSITEEYQLNETLINGTFVRKRFGTPDEILLERNEISSNCNYTI